MQAGLTDIWARVTQLGTKVVVFLDNPRPPKEVLPVYQCILKHKGKNQRCAFDRAAAVEASASSTQRLAAEAVHGVKVIDLADYICPSTKCAPVIGDVLIYRQGSHITNTYARTLAPVITNQLRRALSADGR
jgi:hypothetical protein